MRSEKMKDRENCQLGFAPDTAMGVNAADAAQHISGVNCAPDAGERKKRFQQLITGEFKDLYDRSVQHIIRQRLKDSGETKYAALVPALKALAAKYGVDESDAQALCEAIMEDNDPQKAQELLRRKDSFARRQYEKWIEEASQAGLIYPEFSLEMELENEQFRQLLLSGVPVKAAYELIHRQELMDDYARKLTGRILAGTLRPREGALNSACAAGFETDVSRMSRSARQEIIKRVQKGEKISF